MSEQPVALTLIFPKDSENFFEDMEADWRSDNPNVWREIMVEDYDYCLNVLPPLGMNGGWTWCGGPAFMVSEPYTHTQTDVVFTGCVRVGRRYFARLVESRQFERLVAELTVHLGLSPTPKGWAVAQEV